MFEEMSYTALAGQIVSLSLLVIGRIMLAWRYPEAFEKAKEPGA